MRDSLFIDTFPLYNIKSFTRLVAYSIVIKNDNCEVGTMPLDLLAKLRMNRSHTCARFAYESHARSCRHGVNLAFRDLKLRKFKSNSPKNWPPGEAQLCYRVYFCCACKSNPAHVSTGLVGLDTTTRSFVQLRVLMPFWASFVDIIADRGNIDFCIIFSARHDGNPSSPGAITQ